MGIRSYIAAAAFFSFCMPLGEATYTLEQILDSYDSSIRPQYVQGPTPINVSVVLNSIEVNSRRQVLEVTGEMMQEWRVRNLRFAGGPLHHTEAIGLYGELWRGVKQRLWMPDLVGGDTVDHYLPPNSDFLRIESDGTLRWTRMFQLSAPCDMELEYYPMGELKCYLKFHSLGYDTEELWPSWAGAPAVDVSNTHISFPYQLREEQEPWTTAKTVVSIHRARKQLEVELILESYYGWTVKHTVLPMVASVTLSYMAFFLDPTGESARMMTCLLAFITAIMFNEFTYRHAPQAPFTMALEIFTGMCLTFIWLATVESVIVSWLARGPPKDLTTPNNAAAYARESEGATRGQLAATWLDRCMRVAYPVLFIASNAVYWIIFH